MIPAPVTILQSLGEFSITKDTGIGAADSLADIESWLRSSMQAAIGLDLRANTHGQSSIMLDIDSSLPTEGYVLDVAENAVRILGGSPAGVFYGCTAFLQQLPPEIYRRSQVRGIHWSVPTVSITDQPRFAWRGVMLDVARHFMPKHDVLRFIDLLAMHRLNILHLHLTDDQGWRIEIKRYPDLTEVGGWRKQSQVGKLPIDRPGNGRPHGGFYTQDDMREIVAYAEARYITIVPEIDSPGHVGAAIAAYPELGMEGASPDVSTRWGINEDVLNMEQSTVDFFKHVFDEILDIFPSSVIGIGGDECLRTQWEQDRSTQQRMAELGLADEAELQPWFVSQLYNHLHSRGRRLFGWDEILDSSDLGPDALVASWRGSAGAVSAARRGFDVVSCPDDQVYLDFRQSEDEREPIPVGISLDLESVFNFDPIPQELNGDESTRVLGGQGNIWTEHMDSPRTVDYFAFPRICALSEALWKGDSKDYEDFRKRLPDHLKRLDSIGVEYRPESGPRPWQERPDAQGSPLTRAERDVIMAKLIAGVVTEYSRAQRV